MVWDCMTASGIDELVFIDGTMDKFIYKGILEQNLKRSAEKLGLAQDFFFQQDNDPIHKAEIVLLWILFNISHQINTPPQSLHVNPIEHLWEELGRTNTI
mgnify:CR=1 FL=1